MVARAARSARSAYFEPALFRFLKELEANNNREWFMENKQRYETQVKQPMLRFIADFGAHLRKVSTQFDADPRPVGGSMFRIYRDTRFAKDKTPFKTAAAAHFRHRAGARDVHAPGFYLHLEPGNCLGGGGLWHPDAPALRKVRDRIVQQNKEWAAVLRSGITIKGDALKRVPAGYDPEHPHAEDFKRKDLYVMCEFSEKDACSPDFLEQYAQICRSSQPLVKFLTKAVGLAW